MYLTTSMYNFFSSLIWFIFVQSFCNCFCNSIQINLVLKSAASNINRASNAVSLQCFLKQKIFQTLCLIQLEKEFILKRDQTTKHSSCDWKRVVDSRSVVCARTQSFSLYYVKLLGTCTYRPLNSLYKYVHVLIKFRGCLEAASECTNVPLSSARTWTPLHHPLKICPTILILMNFRDLS